MVYFDQSRQLDPELTLRRALAPDSDAVIYQGNVIHVAAWAARFLFGPEDLNQRVGKLSGGERARVLIAQLMLQEADVLLLDEPTNDLDIPTLEILEESLLEFKGALLLVTHDRYLLDRVSTIVLGLDGRGGAERFADYSQWDAWQKKHTRASTRDTLSSKGSNKGSNEGSSKGPSSGGSRTEGSNGRSNDNAQLVAATTTKRKLSYQEAREFANIEDSLVQAESELSATRAELADPQLASDVQRLMETCKRMEAAQDKVERLYARWAELAEKKE
jgi:ATP-binding cassette subfamily F protein uup